MISLAGDTLSRFADSRGNPAIIVSANRLCRALQVFRVGRAISEQVDDLHAITAPCLGEANTAPNRGVILCLISGRRVQSDEYSLTRTSTPRPAEAESVSLAPGEAGFL